MLGENYSETKKGTANKALQPTPEDRRGRSEGQGRARLTLCR